MMVDDWRLEWTDLWDAYRDWTHHPCGHTLLGLREALEVLAAVLWETTLEECAKHPDVAIRAMLSPRSLDDP